MKLSNLIKAFILTAPAIIGGCASEPVDPAADEETPVATEGEALIHIMGGKPSGLTMSGRAGAADAPQPARAGLCNADRLRVWVYMASKPTLSHPTFADLTSPLIVDDTDILFYSGANDCNRSTYYHFTVATPNVMYCSWALPSLAYSKKDENLFETPDTDYAHLTVSLKQDAASSIYRTPELYFGRLAFDKNGDKNTTPNANGLITTTHALTRHDWFDDRPARGTLYRIVSQFNITVKEVDPKSVKKMELFVSNLPVSLRLFGTHGTFYPVEAAAENSRHYHGTGIPEGADPTQTDPSMPDYPADWYVKVAETTEFSTGAASISTFMLPSAQGQKLKLRVWYETGDGTETGKKLESVDCLVLPESSVFLTGEDVKAYDAAASQLTIYDADSFTYHSFSNVRVNISGKFEDIFAEKKYVDVNVEICPEYEQTHDNFTFDY